MSESSPRVFFHPPPIAITLAPIPDNKARVVLSRQDLAVLFRPSLRPSAGANTLFVSSQLFSRSSFLSLPLNLCPHPHFWSGGEFYKAGLAATSALHLIKMFL